MNSKRGATDDLDDFCQAGAVADRQGMFAPDPFEAFLCHAEGNNDIDVIAVVFVGGVFESGGDFIAFGWVIVYKVGDLKDPAIGSFDEVPAWA